MQVFERAQARLNRGLSICIFPEGGVPDDESILLDDFKDGAFRLALSHHIPIVPLAFADNKKRFSYTFFSGSPGIMRAKFCGFVETEGLDDSKMNVKMIRDKSREQILEALVNFQGVEKVEEELEGVSV